MIAQALIGIQGLLLLSIAYFGYQLVTTLLISPSAPEIRVPEAHRTEPGNRAFERYIIIGERDLFNTAESAEPPSPSLEKIETSKFAVQLIVTLASPDEPEESVAMLESTISGAKMVVRVGDDLFGATVERIERNRVVVLNEDQLEEIVPRERDARLAGPGRNGGKTARKVRPGRRTGAARARRSRQSQSISERLRQISKPRGSGLLGPGGILSQARLVRVPSEDGGRALSLTKIQNGSALEAAGFQDGDVQLSVNGTDLGDGAAGLRALRDIDTAERVSVEVNRGGETLTFELGPGGS